MKNNLLAILGHMYEHAHTHVHADVMVSCHVHAHGQRLFQDSGAC